MEHSFTASLIHSARNLFKGREAVSHTYLMQSALWAAMLSVIFERFDTFLGYLHTDEYFVSVIIGVMALSLLLFLHPKLHRIALVLFAVGLLLLSINGWPSQANHSWLAVWIIAPAALLYQWWNNVHYQRYIRITMGIVMVAAGIQKLVTQTYLDGSYITYLSNYGSISEQMFGFLCNPSGESCLWHAGIGTFLVIWQFVVGLFLITGLAGVLVLLIEVSFLLGAGIFADEMNFQVLTISALVMAFGYGMARWLLIVCVGFLFVDLISIGSIVLFFKNAIGL